MYTLFSTRIAAVGGALALAAAAAVPGAATAAPAGPPDPPANLRVVDLQPESLTADWDPVPGATRYTGVLVAQEAFCGNYYRTFSTTQLSLDVDALNWDCPYRIGVRAFVPSAYPHTYTELTTILVTTPFPVGYEPPGSPSNLRVERNANGQVERVRWDPATQGFGTLLYRLSVEVEGIPELDGPWGPPQAMTSRDVRQDVAEIGSVLQPGQTLTLRVTTDDRAQVESPPGPPLVLACCPL